MKALFHTWAGIAFLKSLSGTFVLQELQKRSAEKGFPASLTLRRDKGKRGDLNLRFSQLVTAASYFEADVSAYF